MAISHVQYGSGFRADLERIGRAARRHDALLVVDVIQAMGALPINVEAELIDAAAGRMSQMAAHAGRRRAAVFF